MFKRKDLIVPLVLGLMLGLSAAAGAQSTDSAKSKPGPCDEPQATFSGFWSGKLLGVIAEDFDSEQAKQSGQQLSKIKGGALVLKVIKNSAADRAGLKVNDVIVEIDGQPIESARALRRKIRQLDYGKPIPMRILRQGAPMELSFTLEKATEGKAYYYAYRLPGDKALRALERAQDAIKERMGRGPLGQLGRGRLGVAVQDLTEQLGQYFGVEKGRGVLITSVYDNSPAAKAGLKAGDCIVEINGAAIADSRDLRNELRKVETGEVRITVVRDRRRLELRATLEPRNSAAYNFKCDPSEFDSEFNIEVPEIDQLPDLPEIVLPEIDIEPGDYDVQEDFDMDTDL